MSATEEKPWYATTIHENVTELENDNYINESNGLSLKESIAFQNLRRIAELEQSGGEIDVVSVRAKFQVQSVTDHIGGNVSVVLHAVHTGSDENKAFWNYTPNGKLEMTISNPKAADFFEPGGHVYLDFTKA